MSMSLRRAFLIFAATLALIGVSVASTLIVLTTSLHRTAQHIGTAVESVRIAEELEFGLVALREASGPLAHATIEQELSQQLREAAHYVESPREHEILSRLGTEVEAYLAAIRRSTASRSLSALQEETRGAFASAFTAAREVIQINVEQSHAAKRVAARWDRTGNVIGMVAILIVVVGVGGLVWWLQRATFRPATNLADAIERYAAGNRAARASEQGPMEFRRIAHRFNDMASTLDRQRHGQIAFLAGVAHDLRNPLSALKLATGMITPEEPLPSEDRVRSMFARVQRQIDRLDRMVYDFLDAARIEAGNLEIRMEECDLTELVHATVDLFAPTSPRHHLVASVPDERVRLICDPVRLEQVLNNLVSNAIKYSPSGGTVGIRITRRSGTVILSVADEGVGMLAEDVEQVFEPFRRTGASKDAIPGVGLGLFVARRIVEAHGGHFTVDTAPGKGSTFNVHLPDKAREEVGSSRPSTTASPGKPPR
jgi:two-component system, OmpR family, sensor histidine kinase MtrB